MWDWRDSVLSWPARKSSTKAAIWLTALAALALSTGGVWAAESFIADSRTGCRVWNPEPKPGETVEWDGSCKDNLAHGFGTLIWYQNGVQTEEAHGQFKAGRLEGDGRWEWSTGHRYKGDFEGGQFNGYGRFTWPSGAFYAGDFRNNERHGEGHHRAANGAQYKGPYVENERHGVGVCSLPGGDWKSCRWWHGERLKEPLQV